MCNGENGSHKNSVWQNEVKKYSVYNSNRKTHLEFCLSSIFKFSLLSSTSCIFIGKHTYVTNPYASVSIFMPEFSSLRFISGHIRHITRTENVENHWFRSFYTRKKDIPPTLPYKTPRKRDSRNRYSAPKAPFVLRDYPPHACVLFYFFPPYIFLFISIYLSATGFLSCDFHTLD